MTREQFQALCRRFVGTTIRDLRHFRDVPRAAIQLPIVKPVEAEVTRVLRRAS
jgi:hypothetical protein